MKSLKTVKTDIKEQKATQGEGWERGKETKIESWLVLDIKGAFSDGVFKSTDTIGCVLTELHLPVIAGKTSVTIISLLQG